MYMYIGGHINGSIVQITAGIVLYIHSIPKKVEIMQGVSSESRCSPHRTPIYNIPMIQN